MTNTIECPACAGPDNAGCETCLGTSEVTQDVYDAFIEARNAFEANASLKRAFTELPVENIPGQEQSFIVISKVDDTLTADLDGTQLTWDAASNSWV